MIGINLVAFKLEGSHSGRSDSLKKKSALMCMHFFLSYIKHCNNHFISLSSLKMIFPHLLTSRCMFPLQPWDPFKQFIATSCVSLLVTDLWPWALPSTKFQDTFCIIESYSISSVSCLSSLFKSLPCCPAQLLNLCCTVKYKSGSF